MGILYEKVTGQGKSPVAGDTSSDGVKTYPVRLTAQEIADLGMAIGTRKRRIKDLISTSSPEIVEINKRQLVRLQKLKEKLSAVLEIDL